MDDLDVIGASLSPWMRKALLMLARKDMVRTCTSVGSSLTGRQSAYGWQTSAREGGRTLHALERRGLAFQLIQPPAARIFPWSLTTRGRLLACHLAAPAAANPLKTGHATRSSP